MELRTIVKTTPSTFRIGYDTGVMLIGSCFASDIGARMQVGKLPVFINPTGTMFNPVSVSDTLKIIMQRKHFVKDDLYNNDGTWLSLYHYSDFSSDDPEKVLTRINSITEKASDFLHSAKFLFLTFGTARIYRWKGTGFIVSNCHKIASSYFDQELLSVKEIVELWNKQLDILNSVWPDLKVIFTISPVRHWKDGAHGNQVSKSVLFLAVEELVNHPAVYGYFPAYEIVMDDLRDYRYYGTDMIHLSETAVDYIWNIFSGAYLEDKALEIWKEVSKITKAASHRIMKDSPQAIRKFAGTMLKRIESVVAKVPDIDMEKERGYFNALLSGDVD